MTSIIFPQHCADTPDPRLASPRNCDICRRSALYPGFRTMAHAKGHFWRLRLQMLRSNLTALRPLSVAAYFFWDRCVVANPQFAAPVHVMLTAHISRHFAQMLYVVGHNICDSETYNGLTQPMYPITNTFQTYSYIAVDSALDFQRAKLHRTPASSPIIAHPGRSLGCGPKGLLMRRLSHQQVYLALNTLSQPVGFI